ncbi:MAG: undecaprenyl-phosphate glucose phosphotransferase [Acidobacteria bacterium]|nr:undecaprenyl-phosphate glucose phosphotransferase [Acidobacteriota bacterium]MBP8274806.1 undecaprenyl-phosphate glucose phosphotransferase [Acidobacteriota bacterium]
MLKRYNRLLVFLHVIADVLSGVTAFGLAYWTRFELLSTIAPLTKGHPPFSQYLSLLPFIGILIPVAFHLQGLYRLRRGRTRVDDFFAVLVGSIVAVLGGIAGTLYVQTYYVGDTLKAQGYYEVSQLVWVLFLIYTVALTFTARETARSFLRARWRSGKSLRRVLIAGSSDLGRTVADRLLEHRELGFTIVGFIDDKAATGDGIGYRGLPLLGALADVGTVCTDEDVHEIYVALPLDEHVKMLGVVEYASRECIDVHVVPDLLQFIALRSRLEDLDGLPIISIHDVPLRGMNAVVKRLTDIAISAGVIVFTLPFTLLVALLIKRSSPGPIFYSQERMSIDGQSFRVYKFRSMPIDAESSTGPIWARDDDPRATRIGRWLRHTDVDELPQFWNVLKGDMSIVGPRPERPFFVEQFKHRIPQYMLRHKVKAGITGWAQVNGWRGNTSLEKRIEFDLYYIENWSLSLDFKIMWLTVMKGVTHS